MLRKLSIAAAVTLLPFAAAHAQDAGAAPAEQPAADAAAGIEVGATVKDKAGATIGTVKEVKPDGVVISTAKGLVQIPASGLGKVQGGFAIGLTKAEVEAAVAAKAN